MRRFVNICKRVTEEYESPYENLAEKFYFIYIYINKHHIYKYIIIFINEHNILFYLEIKHRKKTKHNKFVRVLVKSLVEFFKNL